MDFVRKTGLLQWALSGGLLGAGFVFSVLWPFGIVGIAYFLYLARQGASAKKVALGGFVAWTTKSLAALLCFLSVYPIEWLNVSLGKTQLLIVIFYWITNSLWLGVGGIFVGLAANHIFKKISNKVFLSVLLPVFWIGGELVGSFSFALMTYGDGAVITSAYSLGYTGYLLAQHEWLMQLARVYGVYGLSFVSVLLALGFLWSAQWLNRKGRYFLVLVFALFWVSAYLPFISFEQKIDAYNTVVTLDTRFPVNQIKSPGGEKEIAPELEKAIQKALTFEPDYIVLPEDTRYFNQTLPAAQEKARFQFLHNNPEVILVDSGQALVEGKVVLQAFTYNGLENVVDQSNKRYLVPQGEFMPIFYSTVFNLIGYGEVIQLIKKDTSYIVGPLSSQADAATSTPGILYCFESVSPWGVRKIMKERGTVPFIAHPISHVWFNEPVFLWKNLDSMLRVQAIWNQQYIVSAGAHVAGHVYTPEGKILSPENIAFGDNWTLRRSLIPILP